MAVIKTSNFWAIYNFVVKLRLKPMASAGEKSVSVSETPNRVMSYFSMHENSIGFLCSTNSHSNY